MTTAAADLTIEYADSPGMRQRREDLLAVYAEIYANELSEPFFSVPRYWERLEAYASRAGFSLVLGWIDGELVGYALGYTLPPNAGWWRGLRGDIPPEVVAEDGHRTFAINEIMVRAAWRRRGYARALHDALLRDRPEERATLLVEPDNVAARGAYLSWGWRKLSDLQPFVDAPVYEAMLLESLRR